jgi:hypothetical protein
MNLRLGFAMAEDTYGKQLSGKAPHGPGSPLLPAKPAIGSPTRRSYHGSDGSRQYLSRAAGLAGEALRRDGREAPRPTAEHGSVCGRRPAGRQHWKEGRKLPMRVPWRRGPALDVTPVLPRIMNRAPRCFRHAMIHSAGGPPSHTYTRLTFQKRNAMPPCLSAGAHSRSPPH